MSNNLDEVREPVLEAMQAVFDFCERITEDDVTIEELVNVMKLSIADGWDMLQISISMLSIAAEEARKQCTNTPPQSSE